MSLLILALLLVLQQTNALLLIGENEDNYNKSKLNSFKCDDNMLTKIGEQLEHIQMENENLRLKLDTINMIFNHQFMELKSATTTHITSSTPNEATNLNCGYSYDHLIDVRGDFNKDNECQPAAFKTELGLPSNCAEAMQQSGRQSGVHKIHIPASKLKPFFVYCLADPELGAAWTIIQRRMDGSINFFRKWDDYQQGFGNLEGEFFIGLDNLHAMTQSSLHELWIEMEDFQDDKRSAKYSSFAIGGPSKAYAINVLGSYTGNAGDSLSAHAGYKFTTHDMDNDIEDMVNCANDFRGGWWYHKCYNSNLNGLYLRGTYTADKYGKGVVWNTWHQMNYSLKYVHMAIRSCYLLFSSYMTLVLSTLLYGQNR